MPGFPHAWTRSHALFLALLIAPCGALAGNEEMFRPRNPGEAFPVMTLNDLEGNPRTIRPNHQRVGVLVFFWSVYCPNCKEVMPSLVDLHDGSSLDGVDIWAVNVDGERFSNAVRAYVDDMELPFPVVYDRLEGDYLVAADPLGVSKTPTLYLADAQGMIALRQVIRIDLEEVTQILGTLNH